MIRTFRYPLLPTAAQEATLERWLVLCQRLYNGALEQRKDAWRKQRVTISRFGQCVELTELRQIDAEVGAVPLEALRSGLMRVDEAFRGFFRRVKRGEKPGFPRFRSRDRYDSMGIGRVLPQGDRGDRVRVPRLGLVRFKLYRPLKGTVRNVTLKRTAKRWYVCFAAELGDAPPKRVVRSATGIDVGLTTFATMSDGSTIENPRFMRAAAEQLADRQRRLARKKRGSAGRKKAKALVVRQYEHVRNQRLDLALPANSHLPGNSTGCPAIRGAVGKLSDVVRAAHDARATLRGCLARRWTFTSKSSWTSPKSMACRSRMRREKPSATS